MAYHIGIKRFGGDAPANYRIETENGDRVWANWLNVNGVRLGFPNGRVELSGKLTVNPANAETDSQGRDIAAGVFIETED